jgi:hypothetical protein
VYPGQLPWRWEALKYRLYRAAMGDGVAISTAGEGPDDALALSLVGVAYYLYSKYRLCYASCELCSSRNT